MAPPSIPDVGSSGREFGLELKRIPGCDRVSWEPHRVSMTPWTSVSRKNEWLGFGPVVHLIEKMKVIQQPQGVKTSDARGWALLPVYPPEVTALFFQLSMKYIQICVHEFGRGRIEQNWCVKPRMRVVIESNFQSSVVQSFRECLGIGKEGLVPRVTSPASVGNVFSFHQVPVHVYDSNR